MKLIKLKHSPKHNPRKTPGTLGRLLGAKVHGIDCKSGITVFDNVCG